MFQEIQTRLNFLKMPIFAKLMVQWLPQIFYLIIFSVSYDHEREKAGKRSKNCENLHFTFFTARKKIDILYALKKQ